MTEIIGIKPPPPPVLSSKDKTDILLALREVSRAIESGRHDNFPLMQAIGTELLVLALRAGPRGPLPDDMTETAVETLARREVMAIADSIARFHKHQTDERKILNERLMRVFDPSLAFNEAVNRAIEAKKAAGLEIKAQTPQQKVMFETIQVPSLMKALENAGVENPEPTVHKVNKMLDMDELAKLGIKDETKGEGE